MALPTDLSAVQYAPGTTAAKKSYLFPFIMVTSLFFFWGFIHNLDPALIPHLRRAFSLNTVQASLIDSAVYFGYFILICYIKFFTRLSKIMAK